MYVLQTFQVPALSCHCTGIRTQNHHVSAEKVEQIEINFILGSTEHHIIVLNAYSLNSGLINELARTIFVYLWRKIPM